MKDRIRYFLLDWKDEHLDEFQKVYGAISLTKLTNQQLFDLFSHATHQDLEDWGGKNQEKINK